MIRLTALNFLSYKEVEELKTEGSPYKETIIETIKSNLMRELVEKTPNDVNLDLAFRIQIQLQDDMNLVGKIEQIPVNHVVLNVPDMSQPIPGAMFYGREKLTLRDRIKVLFKGRI
jgi:hypothetical protein